MSLAFRILGPLEVVDDDRVVPLGGIRQRALLAILLLRANQVVSTDHLIEEVWGASPPPTARQTVQVYVSQLRRVLPVEGAPEGRTIETRAPGYLLHVGPGQLDLDRFEELVTGGRAALGSGDAESAARILREALALWRGPPLADFAYEEFAQGEIARLEERRLACVEERIEADLALGRHADLVGELESLVAAHPLRERLRGQLMVALYGSGRQAEALECYAAGRRALADELGLEPGRALRELERRILNQDPDLLPVRPLRRKLRSSEQQPAAWSSRPARAARVNRRFIGAGAAVLAAAAILAVVLGTRGGDRRTVIAGDSVVAIDASGGRASAPVEIGTSPSQVAVADGAVWIGASSSRTVRRIDPRTNAVVDTIPLEGGPDGIVVAQGSVWATNAIGGRVERIRPETNAVVQRIPVPNGPRGIAFGEGGIWVASLYARAVTRIDPATGRPTLTSIIGGSPLGIAAGHGAVWVTNESHATVSRIDPATGRVLQTIGVGNAPGPIAVGADAVWVANTLDGTLTRISPRTSSVTGLTSVGDGPAAIAVDDDAVWVASEVAGTVVRVDPRTGDVVERIVTGQRPAALAVDGRRIWVGARDASATHRGGTLRVVVDGFGDSIDQFNMSLTWLLNLTTDGLVAYRRAPGTQGASLVPDLAVSIPTPTDDGRTYAFQVRRGVRYSNGEPVGPEDFRRSLERYYRLGNAEESPPYYDAIVGAAQCRQRRARCDLSRGIVTDAAAGTVTFHLTRPDPDFIHYLALPFAHAVAPSAPTGEVSASGLAATGPYLIASHQRDRELRFVRNPRFQEWSKVARPDGYVDEIVLTAMATKERMVAAVEEGEADLALFDRPDRALFERWSVQYPDRIRTDPLIGTLLVALNTTRPPFDRLDARKAVAFALDRDALIVANGATEYTQPACQILPPNFPSHEPYCPYTADPDGDGRWHGPDLAEARRLVNRSGTAGATVVVNTTRTFAREAQTVARDLNRIGYRARAQVLDSEKFFAAAYSGKGPGIQVGLSGWVNDIMAPSTFIGVFRCGNSDPARFCDPAIDRQIDEALRLQGTDPVAADKKWTQIDYALTDQAAWIPYATPQKIQFLGRRVGNYQFHPVFWQMLDQMWVR